MDTGKKVREADYFLNVLQQTSFNNRDEFHYNLSAFLSAYRSILDIMLYDFAEIYRIGLTRENKMFYHDFNSVAHATQNTRAYKFIRWWKQKRDSYSDDPLWRMRLEIVHRGYPEMRARVYACFSSIVSSERSISNKIRISEFQVTDSEVLEMCQKGLDSMKDIVRQAEKKFGFTLT